jgi:putative membrane protein
MLAWVRTGVALMGFGFVVARFGLFLRELAVARGVEPEGRGGASLWVGTAMLLVGVALNVIAAVRYAKFAREFETNPSGLRATGIGTEMAIAGVLTVVGILLAGYLLIVE